MRSLFMANRSRPTFSFIHLLMLASFYGDVELKTPVSATSPNERQNAIQATRSWMAFSLPETSWGLNSSVFLRYLAILPIT